MTVTGKGSFLIVRGTLRFAEDLGNSYISASGWGQVSRPDWKTRRAPIRTLSFDFYSIDGRSKRNPGLYQS